MRVETKRKKYNKLTTRLSTRAKDIGGNLVCILRGNQRVWSIVGRKLVVKHLIEGIPVSEYGPTLGELARKLGIMFACLLLVGCVPPGTTEPDVGPYARQRWTTMQQDVEAAKAKMIEEQKANRHTYRQQKYSETQDEFRTRRYDGKFTDRRWQELYLDRVDD